MRVSLFTIGVGWLALGTACRSGAPDGGYTVHNNAPSVSITSPVNESSFYEGSAVTFHGIVDDDGGMDQLLVSWTSDLDGPLTEPEPPDAAGNTEFTTASLGPGNHIVTLLVLDEQAESAEDFVAISVADIPDAPTIFAVHPAGGESGEEEEEFEFVAKVSDSQDPPEAIQVTFTSDHDPLVPFCTVTADLVGIASCEVELEAGDHMITMTAADLDGFTASVDAFFAVVPLSQIDNDGDGFTEELGDCDDDDKYTYPSAQEIFNGRDDDCDGVADDGTVGYDDDGDGQTELAGDCNDADAAIYNFAPEIVDGKDNDCNGLIDDGTDAYDDDGDGWTENTGDCDDDDDDINPGAPEVFNGRDDDCDTIVDEGTDAYDDDGDGYTELAGDCDDSDPTTNPGANEIVDFKDNDCNGLVDDGTDNSDDDGDGYTEVSGDCDDNDNSVYPGAPELIDGKDNDCDGLVDDGTDNFDDDFDGWTEVAGDCNDGDNRIYPGAPEIEDGVDNNCNGVIDEGGQGFDDDGDGYSENDGDCNDSNPTINPGAAEVCDDGKDSDCDGNPNEEGAGNCQTYYQDADDDGAGKPGTGRCLCLGGQGAWDAQNQSDCYDSNNLAKPGGGFQNVHRGDGSFDYDCDGSETRRWGSRAECSWVPVECVSSQGWMDSVQACGNSGRWTIDCSLGWNVCDRDHDSNKTQECK